MESTSGTAGGNRAWVARSDERQLQPKSSEIALVQWDPDLWHELMEHPAACMRRDHPDLKQSRLNAARSCW